MNLRICAEDKSEVDAKSINSLLYLEIASTNDVVFGEVDLRKYRRIGDWYEDP